MIALNLYNGKIVERFVYKNNQKNMEFCGGKNEYSRHQKLYQYLSAGNKQKSPVDWVVVL